MDFFFNAEHTFITRMFVCFPCSTLLVDCLHNRTLEVHGFRLIFKKIYFNFVYFFICSY